jgi:hypothetical protein
MNYLSSQIEDLFFKRVMLERLISEEVTEIPTTFRHIIESYELKFKLEKESKRQKSRIKDQNLTHQRKK